MFDDNNDMNSIRGRDRDHPIIALTRRTFGEKASLVTFLTVLLGLVLLASIGPTPSSSPSITIPSSSSITSITSISSIQSKQTINDYNITNNNIINDTINNEANSNKIIDINGTTGTITATIIPSSSNNSTITNKDVKVKRPLTHSKQQNHIGILSVYVYIFIVLFFIYAIIIVAIRLRMRGNGIYGARRDDNGRRMQMMLHLLRSRGGMTAALSGLRDLPAIVRLAMTTRDFNGDDYELLSQLDDQSSNQRRGVTESQLSRFPLHTITFTELNNMNYDTNNNDSNNTTVRRTSSRNNINSVADNNINNSDKRNCSICLAPYDVGDSIRTIPCLHYFHQDCIDTWLTNNQACPICKYSCNASEGGL